jgi:ADP-ribose pyrophosphatase YjhB (NUDIX family)
VEEPWLTWAKKLQAISQIGLTYTRDPYDRERYEQIGDLALEILSQASGVEKGHFKSLFVADTGYVTPKVDLRAAVFQDKRILLVQEASDGCWTLPGGWADVCETPSVGIVREVYEESGYKVRPVKLIAVLDRSHHAHVPPFPYHVYKCFFLCEIIKGAPRLSHEIAHIDFFPRHRLPPLSLSRVLPQQIELMFHHYFNPGLPTVYD